MSTDTISITVDADAAQTFSAASPKERRKLELLLGLRLRELTATDRKLVFRHRTEAKQGNVVSQGGLAGSGRRPPP